MSEWKEVRLGDVCSIFGRIGFRGYTTEDLVETPQEGAISLSPSNIVQGDLNLDKLTYIKWIKYEESPEIKIKRNDILLVKTGSSIGRTTIVKEVVHPMTLNPQLVVLKDITINPLYLSYLMKGYYFQGLIHNIAGGSAIPTLSQKHLSDLKITICDNDTQNKIAQTISPIDDKIAVNKKICENLEAQAQALFKHWFVDFAPFKDGQFVESEFGLIPEGWRVGTIQDLASKMASGGTPSSTNRDYYGGNVLWFSTKELNDNFLLDSEKHITRLGLDNSSAKLFPKDTVLMAIYAAPTVGRLGILSQEATFNQAAVGIVAKEEIGYEYIYLLLLSERKNLNNLACGAAQQNLNVGIVKNYKCIIPSKTTLSTFRDYIALIFLQLKELQEESSRLATFRDTLLPKLMSGQIKLNEYE